MPQFFVALGGLLAAAASSVAAAAGSLGTLLGGAGFLSGIGGQLLGIGLSLGLTFLLGVGAPKVESPTDAQRTRREAVGYRRKIYGRKRESGQLLIQRLRPGYTGDFAGGGDENFLVFVIAICDRESAAIEKFTVDGRVVDLDVNLEATRKDADDKYVLPPNTLRFAYRLGTPDQTAYDELIAAFPDLIDETWRGVGTTHILAMVLTHQKIYERLPNGSNTNFAVEGIFGLVYDPRDEEQDPEDRTTWAADANAALVILDHLTGPSVENGYAIPLDLIDLDEGQWSFSQAADECDVVVAAPRGTTRRRWELHGAVSYSDAPSAGLGEMMAACDGRLLPSSGGKFGLSVGGWREPTLTLTSDHIMSVERTSGAYLGDGGTVIKSRYLSPEHGYIEQDAIEYVHPAAAVRGRKTTSVDTMWSANHGQTRHLQKSTAARLNTPMQLIVETDKWGLLLYGERFINITHRNISGSFEITGNIEPVRSEGTEDEAGGDVVGFRFPCIAMTEADLSYDELTEGVEPPPVPPEDDDVSLVPEPPTIDVTVIRDDGPLGGVARVVARVVITDTSTDYFHRIEYRQTGTSDSWAAVDLDLGDLDVDIGGLVDGRSYDFRAKSRSGSGDSEWSDLVTRVVTYDTVAPGVPVNVVATGGVGEVDLSWRGPASENALYVAVYRSLTATFGSATLVDRVATLRNANADYHDGGLAPATYYYFLTAGNGSALESAPVATGAVAVT